MLRHFGPVEPTGYNPDEAGIVLLWHCDLSIFRKEELKDL